MSSITSALLVLAPNAQWNLIDNNYSEIQWFSPEVAQPTQEQVNAEMIRQDAQAPIDACKKQAKALLYETDWSTIPDVANSAVSNPYLVNASEFAAYRSQIRALAINPVADPVWPVMPTEQWSS
jgi:hypothetical protein